MISALAAYILHLPAWAALLLVFALPALESSAFLGFVFPGELALVLGGVLAYQGTLSMTAVVLLGVSGAVVGDSIGYAIGRRHGRWMLDGTLGRLVRRHHLDRAERYLADRGGKAVFFGRFTAALRVMVPGLAGMAGMRYRTFLYYNVAGALLWVTMSVLIGFLGGSSWRHVEHVASRLGLVILAVFTLVIVARNLAAAENSRVRRLSRRVRASRHPGLIRTRYPRTARWLAARLDPAVPTGLSLTAATATAVAATWVFLGLTQDVLAHEELALLDPVVHDWVMTHRTGVLNNFFSTVTWLGANAITVPLLGVTGAVIARVRGSWVPIIDVIAVYATAVILHAVVAQLVHRPRPPAVDWLSGASGWAFPSGHTTQALAAIAVVAHLVGSRAARRTRAVVYSVAVVGVVLVGSSRVYLGMHWMTDVLAALAMATGVVALRTVIYATFAGVQDDPRQPRPGEAPARSPVDAHAATTTVKGERSEDATVA